MNGQEKSDEIGPNTTTAEYWEYDSRIGRRWNVDPKPTIGISPYACFGDNPIWFSDALGDSLPPKSEDPLYDKMKQQVKAINALLDKAQKNLDHEDKLINEYLKIPSSNNSPTPSPSNSQSNTKGSFTIKDAEVGLKVINDLYGPEMARTVERMYRLETNHFRSSQYKNTGTGGMEVHGAAPYYGWTPSFFTQQPVGIYSIFENKGMSAMGGNAQVTDRPKQFIVMPCIVYNLSTINCSDIRQDKQFYNCVKIACKI